MKKKIDFDNDLRDSGTICASYIIGIFICIDHFIHNFIYIFLKLRHFGTTNLNFENFR